MLERTPFIGPVMPLPESHTLYQSSTLGEIKANIKRSYDAINTQLNVTVFGPFSFFLQLGYVPNLSPQYSCKELPNHYLNKNSVRLVLELIGDCDLKDKRILDVGCGRGGTVFVVKQFFQPLSVQGLDLSPNAIAFCRTNHRYDDVRFDEGDAEKLPFAPEQFDVVTNVESSHNYPNLSEFYAEVFRVLAPGGCFLYTDVFPKESDAKRLALLENSGLAIELERDITANVLLSCDEGARNRINAYDAGNDHELLNNFLAVPGSWVYEEMRSGHQCYRIYRLRKPVIVTT